jgi:hypothetical protein
MDRAQAEQVAAAFGRFEPSGRDLPAKADYEQQVA